MLATAIVMVLLVFILEGGHRVKVYLGASGHLPLGVALHLATVGGTPLVGIIGVVRLTQLRLTLIGGGELTPNAGSRGFGRSECDA